ncbi:MAG: hypothetical protein V9E89_19355 [Ilumatobacteraceae bacterium]
MTCFFTGLASGTEPFGLIVIDEGCWQRSSEDVALPPIVKMASAEAVDAALTAMIPVAAEPAGRLCPHCGTALATDALRNNPGRDILPEAPCDTGGLTLSRLHRRPRHSRRA